MKKILFVMIALLILSEGIGTALYKRTGIEKKGYAMPMGFAVILGLSQIFYYPAQLFNLSFHWIIISSTFVLVLALLATIRYYKEVLESFKSVKTLILIVVAVVFVLLMRRLSVDPDFSDAATYLNYISMNINAKQLNLYDLTNGLRGAEWDLYYLFQGYYHFASYIVWLINIPYYMFGASAQVDIVIICVYGLGILFQMLMGSLVIDIVEYLDIDHRYFKYSLMAFLLFYLNFFYWNLSFAYFGNTFRALFIVLSIFEIYKWMKEGCSEHKYVLFFATTAGIACSSSVMFMSFGILYALALTLFRYKYPHALADMMYLITPLVAYVCAFFSRTSAVLALVIFALYVLLLVTQKNKNVSKVLEFIEAWFIKYPVKIFLIAIPVLFALLSVYFAVKNTDWYTNYGYYLTNFRLMDMMSDYLVIYSDWLERILNILRWIGVILVLKNAKMEEDLWIKNLAQVEILFLLNPLCMIGLMKTITGIVFYRNFMVLFNVMCDAVFFTWVYRSFKKTAPKAILSIVLVFAIIMGHYGSFTGNAKTGIYWVYYRDGGDVDPLYKIDADERQALQAMREQVNSDDPDHQPIVVSQSAVTLEYLPEAYSLFTARENHYANTRVNEEFFQIVRKPFGWQGDSEEKPDYSKTCDYLREYNADYILLQYWTSPEYDEASDGCAVTFYTGSKYKVKKVTK